MKIAEYRQYLQSQGLPADAIEQRLALVGEFVRFLADLAPAGGVADAGKGEAERFARRLIAEGRNTPANFALLRDYAEWLGQRKLTVALIEMMDCCNALEVLAEKVEAGRGPQARARIFPEPLPPLGADEVERCAYTRAAMERMAREMTPQQARAAWFQVQHGIPAESWRARDLAAREQFRRCGEDIDAYLDLRRRERDALLTRLRDEGALWHTMAVSDEVLAYVQANPEIGVGRREGDRIYFSRVPYDLPRYLRETDPTMKRYYACHCLLLREAIRQGRALSPDVCHCSLGHASHNLAGLGLELRGEVLESAVQGDLRCRFVFYLSQL